MRRRATGADERVIAGGDEHSYSVLALPTGRAQADPFEWQPTNNVFAMKEHIMKKPLAIGGLVVGLTFGGVIGFALASGGPSNAQSTTTSVPIASAATTVPSGAAADNSNNDATHEAAEDAQHEADETAGNFEGHHGHSNTDAAHEAAESPARAAEEAAADAAPATK